MKYPVLAAGAVTTVLLCCTLANAQSPNPHRGYAGIDVRDSAIRTFVADARTATERYADLSAALRDGFQPMGTETPAMGQHWVSAGRLFRGGFSASLPAGLQYATIEGKLTLVGVAYIVPLLADEMPPAFPEPDRWHTHAGMIDEETFVADHDAAARATGARVSVLHAWIWTDNPAGVFSPDNWSLPFQRAGLAMPVTGTATIGRAVALGGEGAEHFASVIQRYAQASSRDTSAIRSAVAVGAADVQAVLRTVAGRSLTAEQCAALERIWEAMWRRIDGFVAPEVRGRLAPLRGSNQRKEPTP